MSAQVIAEWVTGGGAPCRLVDTPRGLAGQVQLMEEDSRQPIWCGDLLGQLEVLSYLRSLATPRSAEEYDDDMGPVVWWCRESQAGEYTPLGIAAYAPEFLGVVFTPLLVPAPKLSSLPLTAACAADGPLRPIPGSPGRK